jgi:hypothetical protein
MGINVFKVRDGYFYWSNSGFPLFYLIKIDGKGKPTNLVEALERNILIDELFLTKRVVHG